MEIAHRIFRTLKQYKLLRGSFENRLMKKNPVNFAIATNGPEWYDWKTFLAKFNEEEIAKSTEGSYYYAKDVLKGELLLCQGRSQR